MALKLNLGNKLVLYVSITILAVVAAVSGIAVNRVLVNSEKEAEAIAETTASSYAYQLKYFLDSASEMTKTMALTVTASVSADGTNRMSRDLLNDQMKKVLESKPEFLDVYVLFERDAFDGNDEAYRNTAGTDSSGRFIACWSRDSSGKFLVEPLVGFDDGSENYYTKTKRAQKSILIDPYSYVLAGKEVQLASLISPIFDQKGTYIGLVGIDLAIGILQDALEKVVVDGYPGAFLTLYTSTGFLVGSGSDAFAATYKKNPEGDKGEQQLIRSVSNYVFSRDVDNESFISAGYPAEIGTTNNKWIFEISLPRAILVRATLNLTRYVIVSGLIGIVLAILIVALFARSIVRPINIAVSKAGEVAGGDLGTNIPAAFLLRHDEIGTLANALQNMILKLRSVLEEIGTSALQVTHGSKELAGTSQHMSQGATEQAASVEQISASIEQMSSNIRQNAENAMQTEKIARKSAVSAEEGGKAVSDTVNAMKMIASKIVIIEEIARSTNMLSLNASIEAARAGEYGKGFAVVASEVGKLAERSQKEAGEISMLSQQSVKIAEDAGMVILSLIPEIKRTAELVQEISAASNEQNSGTEQISSAILQLDSVIQQNASASEESAAMSEELSRQSEQMQQVISYFHFKKSTAPGYNIDSEASLHVEADKLSPISKPVLAAKKPVPIASKPAPIASKPAPAVQKSAPKETAVQHASVEKVPAEATTVTKTAPSTGSKIKEPRKAPPVESSSKKSEDKQNTRLPLTGIHLVLDDEGEIKGRDPLDNEFQEF